MLLPNVRRKSETGWHYNINETDASGWQTTSYRRSPIFHDAPYGNRLSEDNKELLRWIRQWCERNGVRVAYSLPWGFWEPDDADTWQRTNLALVKQISSILPVLKDPRMGVYPERSHFTDTFMHLNPTGAALRTDDLARQIKAWDVWSPGELAAWEREHLAEGKNR